jgi:hypothetical protein
MTATCRRPIALGMATIVISRSRRPPSPGPRASTRAEYRSRALSPVGPRCRSPAVTPDDVFCPCAQMLLQLSPTTSRRRAARAAGPASAPGSAFWAGPPGARGATLAGHTDQGGLTGARPGYRARPSSSPFIVQLAATASRPPLRASLRDGFASLDPAPTRKDLGAREGDGAEQSAWTQAGVSSVKAVGPWRSRRGIAWSRISPHAATAPACARFRWSRTPAPPALRQSGRTRRAVA